MQTITTDELKMRLEKGESLNLLDVREPSERQEFNIGGIHIPLGKIQSMMLDEIEELKDKEIIVYCRSGNRSGQAAMILEMAGFAQVKNLVGGMLDWQARFA
jgi:rhodanese-related sulfurtransferase